VNNVLHLSKTPKDELLASLNVCYNAGNTAIMRQDNRHDDEIEDMMQSLYGLRMSLEENPELHKKHHSYLCSMADKLDELYWEMKDDINIRKD